MGLLPPPDPDVRQDRAGHRGPLLRARDRPGQDRRGRGHGRRAGRARAAGAGRHLQGHRQGARRDRLPAGSARAARPRDQGRVRLVEHRPREAVPPPGAHPRRPGHRGQRAGDGLRQRRRRLGHGRGVHPRPRDRRDRPLRRLPARRAGRGRRLRRPQHPVPGRHGPPRPRGTRPAAGQHGRPRGALQGPLRHRVHRRARAALHAADPRREAHRRCGLPDRDPARRRGRHRHGRGRPPRVAAPSSCS